MKTINKTITVNPNDYEVFSFNSGYFGICKKGSHGAQPVWGGDSAWEDCYSEELANRIYEEWGGTLTHSGNNKYGENGYTIEG